MELQQAEGDWNAVGAKRMMTRMTQCGFVIDQRACIGCHACTVACKVEHGVELGVFRTWVKYVETGTFPDTRRHFSVLRCNQCTDAPCVEICPVTALYKREDGIVDFDSERCIGCKACLNACPYDALYIDPQLAHGREVQLLRAPGRRGPAARLRGRLPDQRDRLRRRRRPRVAGAQAHRRRSRTRCARPSRAPARTSSTSAPTRRRSTRCRSAAATAYLYSEVPHAQREKLAPLTEEARGAAAMLRRRPPARRGAGRCRATSSPRAIAAGAMMLAGVFAIADVARRRARAGGDRGHRASSSSPTSSSRGASTTCSPGRSGAPGSRWAPRSSTSPALVAFAFTRRGACSAADGVARRPRLGDGARRARCWPPTRPSCSASARAATCGRARCCCRTRSSTRSSPAPRRWASPRCSAPRARHTLRLGARRLLRGQPRHDRASTPGARTRPRRPSARRATCGATASPGASSPAWPASAWRRAARRWSGQRTGLLAAAGGRSRSSACGSTRTPGCAPGRACR